MQIITKTLATLLLGLLATATLTVNAQVPGQQPRFLSLTPPEGLPIIPVFEGWFANADGSTSFSFGIINRNDVPVDIPVGEANYIEPQKYNGEQPTHFPAGRSTGVFVVTVPESEQGNDVWWYVKTGAADVLKVPGRRGRSAYELDFDRPRPQGALQPRVGIGEDGRERAGLHAQTGDFPGNPVRAGEQVELVITATDPAERDASDPRFGEPLPMNVRWAKYQGPGEVTFTRHEDTEVPENPFPEDNPRHEFWEEPAANEQQIPGPSGEARVYATFSEPGEYIIMSKVDVHEAPDSSDGDQCCWTNVYQRVNVR